MDYEVKLLGTNFERTFSPVEYRGAKSSLFMIMWREMETIVKQFGTLSYSK
jgi:hypothetical protein